MPSEATWMDLEIIILNEVSQAEKDKYHMIWLNIWNLKHDTTTYLQKQTQDIWLSKEGMQE